MYLFAVSTCADTGNPLTGPWYGTATITSPATLGTVDLAFYLFNTVAQNAVYKNGSLANADVSRDISLSNTKIGLSVAPGGALLYTEPDTTWRMQGEDGMAG
ncbi:MAG: hypothetical protein WCP20_18560 [Desulfuromonadales bacterium]